MLMARTLVVAFGGNALLPEGDDGSYEEQLVRARGMAAAVGRLVRQGDRVVLSHGNGPHVGNLAIQQENGAPSVSAQPMQSLVAMTQGQIGHLMALSLREQLAGSNVEVVVLVTHVVVDRDDPEFGAPTKPIGPFYAACEAEDAAMVRGWTMASTSDSRRRRVVPSPMPKRLLELESIRALTDKGTVVIAAGGGGIPLVIEPDGSLRGVEAVVDKDLAAGSMATSLEAEVLVLLTAVPEVALDYGTPSQRSVEEMTVDVALGHHADGQFPPGSMGPKIVAATDFINNGGSMAVITSTEHIVAAVEREHGTRIVAS
jgi:carbamate kinase